MFDKAYVINLASRPDRRKGTIAEFRNAGMSAPQFFEAVKPSDKGKFRGIGERGAYESHLSLLRKNIGNPSILVMEDDVKLVPNFSDRCKAVFLSLPENWDLIYLGYFPKKKLEQTVSNIVELDPHIELTGLHCYAVNGHAIKKITTGLDIFLTRVRDHPHGGPMPVDGGINILRQQLQLRSFAAVPPLAYQRSSRSDISQKWFDDVLFLRQGANFLRRCKNIIRGFGNVDKN